MRVRTTARVRADEKLTPDQVRALTRQLVAEGVLPAEVGARYALIGSVVAVCLSLAALAVALFT